MLKIAYFSPVSDLRGGAETSLIDLLCNPNVEATLIVPEAGELSIVAKKMGKPVKVLPLGRVSQIRRPVHLRNVFPAIFDWFKAARNLRSLARGERFDVIHSNGLKAHFVACLCRVLGGPPIVIHIHDIPLQFRERWLWRALGYFGDLVFIVSRPCWPTKGKMPSNVKVLFNGLDTKRLPILPDVVFDHLVIGFCGRLHPYKGVHHLIRWVSYALQSGRRVKLVVRGEHAPEHAEYLRQLLLLVEGLGISDAVSFEGKKLGLSNIYSGIDVVVVPSVVPDALPRSIMEAMGLGLPVIAFPSGGIPSQIKSGHDGFLVRDEFEFLNVIGMMIDNPASVQVIRANAVDTVEREFTIEKMYKNIDGYYSLL